MVLDGRVNDGLTCAMIHDLITAFLVAFAAVTASNCSSRFGSSSSRSVRRGVSRRPPGTLRPARHIHSKATSEAALIVIAAQIEAAVVAICSIATKGKESFPRSRGGRSVVVRGPYVRRKRDQFGRVSTSTLGIGPRSFGSRSERRAHQPFCGTSNERSPRGSSCYGQKRRQPVLS